MGWGYRYFKCLYPISPVEYICLNSSRNLPYGSLVVEIVRSAKDCEDIEVRMPSRNISDIDDMSNSYNMIDDIFIILGGERNSTGGVMSPHEGWFFWPCIGETYNPNENYPISNQFCIFSVCLIILTAAVLFKLKNIEKVISVCTGKRQRRVVHEPEDMSSYP